MAKKTKKQKRSNKVAQKKKRQKFFKIHATIDKKKIESFFPDVEERKAYIKSLSDFFNRRIA